MPACRSARTRESHTVGGNVGLAFTKFLEKPLRNRLAPTMVTVVRGNLIADLVREVVRGQRSDSNDLWCQVWVHIQHSATSIRQ